MSDLENLTDDQRTSLAASMHKLLTNPEMRKDTLRALKKVDPKASFPELELDDRIQASNDRQSERIKELEDKIITGDLERKREKQHEMIRGKGLDPLEVEQFARDKGGMTYEAATEFMLAMKKSAPPTAASITPFRAPEHAKEILKNPGQWARNEASKAIDDIIAARG